jgi:hypothetical protein
LRSEGRDGEVQIPIPELLEAMVERGASDLHITVGTPPTMMSNQNAFYGQVVAGTVVIGNNWSMNYRPIVIPGALVTGFTEDVAYIREMA